ncbi:BlaI/MecI/CopY family transcriptional regulator [Candidatus Latescibacterota bacterium]
MAFKKSRMFTEGEIDFMKVLWEKGEATPEEVQEALKKKDRSLTYGTIRNVLVVLIEKGFVSRSKKGKVYLYKAKVNEIQAKKSMLQNLLKHAFNGSESQLVATLLRDRELHSKEMKEIRRLIEEEKEENQ